MWRLTCGRAPPEKLMPERCAQNPLASDTEHRLELVEAVGVERHVPFDLAFNDMPDYITSRRPELDGQIRLDAASRTLRGLLSLALCSQPAAWCRAASAPEPRRTRSRRRSSANFQTGAAGVQHRARYVPVLR